MIDDSDSVATSSYDQPATAGDDTYHAVRFVAYPFGRHESVLFSREHERVLALDTRLTSVLALCQGSRTLDEHAVAIVRAGVVSNLAAARAALEALRAARVLRSTKALLGAIAASSGSPRPARITTIGIVTADRPALVARSLQSFLGHCAEFGHQPRFIVADGSRSPVNRAANRHAIGLLAEQSCCEVLYVGRDEAAGLHRRLAMIGWPESSIRFALEPRGIGANRNVLLLLTAGQDLLMVDDDMMCDTWVSPNRTGGLALCGHFEPREVQFYSARADALAALPRAEVDLLDAYAGLLNQSVTALINRSAGSVDLRGACGDSGAYCPYRWLFTSGTTQARLASSRTVWNTALTSREVRRIALTNIVTHDSHCMAGCMGLSNRALLPPFMPEGRNEDGVFGGMLTSCDPEAVFAHIPCGLVHDSTRSSRYAEGVVVSASQTRVSEVLLSLVHLSSSANLSPAPRSRMRRLADGLLAVGQMELGDFIAFVTGAVLEARRREMGRAEAAMATGSEYPDYWRSEFDRYRRLLLASLGRPEFFVPIEFCTGGSVADSFARTQAFMRQLGELVQLWPDAWEFCAHEEPDGLLDSSSPPV